MIDYTESLTIYEDLNCIIYLYDNNPFTGIEVRVYLGNELIQEISRDCFSNYDVESFIKRNVVFCSPLPSSLVDRLSEIIRLLALGLEAIL